MNFLLVFFLTFLIAALGVVPPGMLNLKIAQISIKKGNLAVNKFIFGVVLVVFFQSLLGFYCSIFLNNHPNFTKNLKLIGCVVFLGLSLYFFGKGVQELRLKSQKPIAINQKSNYFLYGLFLSAINVFPIPFYGFFSWYLSSIFQNFFSILNGFSFTIGATLGTCSIYWLYAKLFYQHQQKTKFFIKNINFIIGTITLLVGCFTFYKI